MAASEDTRGNMKAFWEQHCTEATLQDVMLDSMADQLDEAEKPEINEMLPNLARKRVLELGAGIGRYTGFLAERSGHVKSVDFIEKFVEKNRELHSAAYPNVEFVCGDVMSLDLGENEFDMIFSNWLLMYLSDGEVEKLAARLLRALKPGGHCFFRESCFRQSGDRKRSYNPTQYRDPKHYHHVFETTECKSADCEDKCYGFELGFSRCIRTYLQIKGNPHQMCWIWTKVLLNRAVQNGNQNGMTTRQFLDQQQYTVNGILRYERVFGQNFVSTGGLETTQEFVPKLEIKEGELVLDAGSGLGGSAFFMAENYGAEVLGVDLSTNMVHLSIDRAVQCRRGSVIFEVSDLTKREFGDNVFDVVYSRDTLLHISDKQELFRHFFRWLKPNGRLMITDYCCGDGEHTDGFKAYVQQRGYTLHTVQEYGQLLERAGFISVVADNRSVQFLDVLRGELKKTEENRKSMISDFSEKDFDDLVSGWKAKIERVSKGDQCWGLFTARKPSV